MRRFGHLNLLACIIVCSCLVVFAQTPPPAPAPASLQQQLVPCASYPPIPSTLTDFTAPATATTSTAPTTGNQQLSDINGRTSVFDCAEIIRNYPVGNDVSDEVSVALQVADPSLGKFARLQRQTATATASTMTDVTTQLAADSSNITFTSHNMSSLADALRSGYAFSLSPETEARGTNLTSRLLVLVSAWNSNGTQSGATAVALNSSALVINTGPVKLLQTSTQCHIDVLQGQKVALDLSVYREPLPDLKMMFGVALQDGFPLPPTLNFACASLPGGIGNCSMRGRVDEADDLVIEVQVSDGFYMRSTLITLHPISIPIRPNAAVVPLAPIVLRPGRVFSYALPLDLFVSSTDIRYESVRLRDGDFALPANTITFDAPNLLRGSWPSPGLLELRLHATDLFYETALNFTLNFTNSNPICAAPRSPPLDWRPPIVAAANATTSTTTSFEPASTFALAPVSALHPFTYTVDLATFCSDSDGDELRFTLDLLSTPFWMRSDIRAFRLFISGTAPREAAGTLLILNITATEASFNNNNNDNNNNNIAQLSLPLLVRQNIAPRLMTPLPNFTIYPGDSENWAVSIAEHFVDDNGDALRVNSVASPAAEAWTKVGYDANSQMLRIAATPPDIGASSDGNDLSETDETITVAVSDPFDAQAVSTITIQVRLTTWQKVRTGVIIASALLSVLLSALGFFFYWSFFVNLLRGKRVVIECPLHWKQEDASSNNNCSSNNCKKSRRWFYPKGTHAFSFNIRTHVRLCGVDLLGWIPLFSHHLYNIASLRSTAHCDPPAWLEILDNQISLNVPPPSADRSGIKVLNCRCIALSGVVTCEFDVEYDKVYNGMPSDMLADVVAASDARQAALEVRFPSQSVATAAAASAVVAGAGAAVEMTNNRTSNNKDKQNKSGSRRESIIPSDGGEIPDSVHELVAAQEAEVRNLRAVIHALLNGSSGSGSRRGSSTASPASPASQGSSSPLLLLDQQTQQQQQQQQQRRQSQQHEQQQQQRRQSKQLKRVDEVDSDFEDMMTLL